jgi:Xaa-Pro aminopeptidase
MVKSEAELKRLTRAAEIGEQAGMISLALAKPGRRLSELIQAYRAAIADSGADFDHFAYSPLGMGIALEPDYVLHHDDVMYVDWGCMYQHYFSDTGTTLAVSQPTEAILQRFQALRDCMDAGIDQLRPGTRASVVQDGMQQALKSHGITASFPHGHGLDLEVRNYPILVPDNGLRIHDDCIDIPSDLPLEEGMVVNLEAPIFLPGVASLHIEETYVITASGSRPLVPQQRSAPFIP